MNGASLDAVALAAWGSGADDAVDWRERLGAQLRDGSFHYIAVAQRFTQPVLRTLQYLNSSMKAARFSAVELVRFAGENHTAFEARFVAGAELTTVGSSSAKAALAGVDELVATVTDDDYRHHLEDFFTALATMPGLTVLWGTTGCSLRVAVPDRSPLSIGWVFPPGPARWMGLSDVTLGWYEDANGLNIAADGRSVLDDYLNALDLPGAVKPKGVAIRGFTFPPSDFVANASFLQEVLRDVVFRLTTPPLT